MQQAANEQQQWKIRVHAKANIFNFRFKATNLVPNWKFRRLSVFLKLKLPRFFLYLRVKAHSRSRPSIRSHQPSFKSRFLRIFHRIRAPRTTRNRCVESTQYPRIERVVNRLKHSVGFADEEPMSIGSAIIGILVFLFRSCFSVNLLAGSRRLKSLLGGVVICWVVFKLFGVCFISECICRWIRNI